MAVILNVTSDRYCIQCVLVVACFNLILFHYLIDQGGDVYIPIAKWIFLYTGEFETTAKYFTFNYFDHDVQNIYLF